MDILQLKIPASQQISHTSPAARSRNDLRESSPEIRHEDQVARM